MLNSVCSLWAALTCCNYFGIPLYLDYEKGVYLMLINDRLKELDMSKYRLSKESGVPQATINDICSGKTDLDKCAVGTLYRIAKVLGISVEEILESSRQEYRSWTV